MATYSFFCKRSGDHDRENKSLLRFLRDDLISPP